MKVISLLQPWATLMVVGSKRIETRSFFTSHRGRLCIHASLGEEMLKLFFSKDPFYRHLSALGYKTAADLPRGCIIGEVTVTDCYKIVNGPVVGVNKKIFMNPPSGDELLFGDYTAGRYGWITENPIRYKNPIPAKGNLGLWNTDLVR